MTQHTQRLRTAILDEIRGQNIDQAIDRLFELGFLSPVRCEAHAMRRETDRLTRQGLGRCEAMEATAETFCCSYEKVRSAVYNHKKI